MIRLIRIFVAYLYAHFWSLIFGFTSTQVLTESFKPKGKLFFRTRRIEVGRGSIFNDNWETIKVFYEEKQDAG